MPLPVGKQYFFSKRRAGVVCVRQRQMGSTILRATIILRTHTRGIPSNIRFGCQNRSLGKNCIRLELEIGMGAMNIAARAESHFLCKRLIWNRWVFPLGVTCS